LLSTFHFLFNLFLEANAEILKKIRCFFGRFEGMLKIPKCPFKINWPLNTKVDFNYFSDRNVCNNFTFNPRCLTSKLDSHASAILVLQKYFHLIALWHKSKAKNETMNEMNESHAWNFEVSKAHKSKALGIRYAQNSVMLWKSPDRNVSTYLIVFRLKWELRPLLKVSKLQNEMKSSILPKYEPKIVRISAL
jgi:hypothetical protein